ncbi:hypothetical protein ACFL6L_02060 [candidate division KSB1 bacterium]
MKRLLAVIMLTGLCITPAFAQLQIERTGQEQAYAVDEQNAAPRLQIFPPMGLTGKDRAFPPGLIRIDPTGFPEAAKPYCQQNVTLAEAIAKLEMNKNVQLKTADLGIVTAVYMGTGESMMTVRIDNTERSVPLTAIEGLWFSGKATKKGAVYGSIIGFLSGAAVGAIIAYVKAGKRSSSPEIVVSLAGGATGIIGGTGGAVIGAVIGSGKQQWHKVYSGSKNK